MVRYSSNEAKLPGLTRVSEENVLWGVVVTQ